MRTKTLVALFTLLAANQPALSLDRSYPCLIEPHKVVELSTAVEGVLEEVVVKKGDVVKQGDVIARLESAVERIMVQQAETRVDLNAAIDARKVSLKRARAKHKRALKLSSQKYLSPEELDEMASAVELARLELEAEHDNRTLAKIDLQLSQARLDQRVLRSPIDGVVVRRYLNAGEFAQAQPIVRVAQLNPLNVEAVLPGNTYGQVAEGDTARVQLLGPDDRTFEAKVSIVEKVIDAASGTFGVRVELPNPEYSIAAGLECLIDFAPAEQD